MKFNRDECYLMIFSKQNSALSMKIDNNNTTESRKEKLLGIPLDETFSFKPHLETLWKGKPRNSCPITNIKKTLVQRRKALYTTSSGWLLSLVKQCQK